MGWNGVVPVRALAVRQALGIGGLLELRAGGGNALWAPGDLLALSGDARVELERAVLHLQVIGLAQLVDPSLADVAPRSNEVAEDEEPDGHALTV
jgi:hypothetical protein